ncbi:endolytic transglycosylase MltG [Paenibacillus pinistramenti]|uniref:endolytic transglycosylase MltG n=1 Tax=Paenibacillus pinistramenti TaxID=1768003 RepID=UPI0011081EED|nr:endolytic transglycosylase MltG [Paenibacillus pinistramenti]
MMRNRQFLFGLGSGLIIGALLLQLMNVAQTQPKMLTSEEDVRSAAETLGLRVYDSSEQVYTEEEWQEKAKTGTASTPSATPAPPSTPAQPADPSSPSTPSAPAKVEKPSAASAAEPSASAKASAQVATVKIVSGTNLTGVAAKLKEAGVISDAAAFIQEAKKWNASTTIQTGTYTFTKGESFKSITDKITTGTK